MKIFHVATVAISLAAIASRSWCAPPLATDDASTLAPGMCQLETEQRRFRHRVESDIFSACNLFFDAEISLGYQRAAANATPRADSIVYQFKKVVGPVSADEWAFGIAAATVRAVNEKSRGHSGTRQNSVNALASRQFGATALHLNIGNVSNHEAAPGSRKNRLAWNIATEHDASARWTLVGEVFGQRGLPATGQVGLRWWAVPKYLQLTTSLGAQRGEGRDGRWLSFGVRFETGNAIY